MTRLLPLFGLGGVSHVTGLASVASAAEIEPLADPPLGLLVVWIILFVAMVLGHLWRRS